MGERGSAPEPSVIRIFAYPGYKGAYTGGFSLLLLAFARLVKSRRGALSLSLLCSSKAQLFDPTSQESVSVRSWRWLRFCQSVCGELREHVELGELVDRELVKLGGARS